VQAVGRFVENLFRNTPKVKVSYRKKTHSAPSDSTTSKISKPAPTSSKPQMIATQDEIDQILDKIADKGYESLNKEEKRKLFDFSKK
jgi:hypothetical protein